MPHQRSELPTAKKLTLKIDSAIGLETAFAFLKWRLILKNGDSDYMYGLASLRSPKYMCR